MNYLLCSKILQHKYCTDYVKELIMLYQKECEKVEHYTNLLLDRQDYIRILETENRLLKEHKE